MPRQETGTEGLVPEWRAPDALLPATMDLTELLTTVASKGKDATPEELAEQAHKFLGSLVVIFAGALNYQSERLIDSAGQSLHGEQLAQSADTLRFAADAFRRITPDRE